MARKLLQQRQQQKRLLTTLTAEHNRLQWKVHALTQSIAALDGMLQLLGQHEEGTASTLTAIRQLLPCWSSAAEILLQEFSTKLAAVQPRTTQWMQGSAQASAVQSATDEEVARVSVCTDVLQHSPSSLHFTGTRSVAGPPFVSIVVYPLAHETPLLHISNVTHHERNTGSCQCE